ncbi:MAG: hypothetical protein HQM10_07665 [Candidatus Riflebacteria bacterium]|nr:hypothetical protein [Candidatus Riflebacteria bacterium]
MFKENRSFHRKISPESAFISVVSLILLLILAVLGLFYWSVSRMSTDMIMKEAHRIKARALAQAGVEKVLVNIMNQYRFGNFDVSYTPGKFTVSGTDKEYSIDFGEGRYSVDSVAPYSVDEKKFQNIPYFKNKVQIGYYDIWQIKSTGEVKQTSTKARINTLLKVIRTGVQY